LIYAKSRSAGGTIGVGCGRKSAPVTVILRGDKEGKKRTGKGLGGGRFLRGDLLVRFKKKKIDLADRMPKEKGEESRT